MCAVISRLFPKSVLWQLKWRTSIADISPFIKASKCKFSNDYWNICFNYGHVLQIKQQQNHFYLQFSFKLCNFVMKNLFHSRNQWKLKRKSYFILTTIPVNDVMKVIDCFCKENALLSLHSVMISWPSDYKKDQFNFG